MKPKCTKNSIIISDFNSNSLSYFRNDENVNNQRRSERARKPVQQMNMVATKSSPRTVTPKKFIKEENSNSIAATPLTESAVYIELDPFAPPPRLSLSGASGSLQSPSVAISKTKTPQKIKAPSVALPAYSGGILFEQLSSPGIALKSVVNDWMNMYESDKERKGTVSLLLVNKYLSCQIN